MKPIEFADKYFGVYKVKGDEIVPKLCPICKGGRKRDADTFAMNVDTGAYNCKRGSCMAQGSFRQLCERFGESPDPSANGFEIRTAPKKSYKKPKTQASTPSSKVEEYLRKRGFSKDTWERRKVGESGGNIVFPYYENGELVLVKFRPARKVGHGERKAWREEGGKPVFWGMDECDPALPLVICEGEMDALALDESGVPNVVSVPSGAEDLTCVDNCWDWLQQFEDVIIWPDNDDPGQEMCRKLIAKLGRWRCRIAKSPCKDANEHMFRYGKDSTLRVVADAKEVPMAGLVALRDVKVYQPEAESRVLSSLKPINQKIGGYLMGQLSVWTGTNGSGKSTFLGQELLMAVDQGFTVCAYSGELPPALFRYWIDTQAAGPNSVVKYRDPITGHEGSKPNPDALEHIRRWYGDKFFLYDSFGSAVWDNLFEVFEYAARRYDAKVFLVDNLMTTIVGGSESEYYRRQSDMVERLKTFAHEYQVHVHLVAHPRKTEGRLSKMDVAGSSDITNRADNVFGIHRVGKEQKIEGAVHDASLDIFKSRFTGMQDIEIQLYFDEDTRRFYLQSSPEMLTHQFGWQRLRAV